MNTFAPRNILAAIACSTSSADRGRVSDADRVTLRQAAWLANRLGARLHLVHVIDFIDQRAARADDGMLASVQSEIQGQLQHELDTLAGRAPSAVIAFAAGHAPEELLHYAERRSIDLIMTSPRRARLRLGDRLLHGSTTEHLVRHARCPVWIVNTPEAGGVHKVLALVDESDVARRVIDAAEGVAGAAEAARVALRCLEYPEDIALRRHADGPRAIVRYREEVRGRARAQLEALTAETPGWETRLGDDWVVRAAPRLVEEEGVDLVVLGVRSYPSLKGVLVGTTAHKLLERLPTSLLIVRPDPS